MSNTIYKIEDNGDVTSITTRLNKKPINNTLLKKLTSYQKEEDLGLRASDKLLKDIIKQQAVCYVGFKKKTGDYTERVVRIHDQNISGLSYATDITKVFNNISSEEKERVIIQVYMPELKFVVFQNVRYNLNFNR